MTAAEAFISLRSKSLLHLSACIGRFLGLQVRSNNYCSIRSPELSEGYLKSSIINYIYLQVYEHGFSPVKVPKDALSGSDMLLMGFPDCGSSYFLLMQLEDDFRPLFKLLETQPDPSGKPESSVTRIKNIDIDQMHMLQGERSLSLLDCDALTSSENYLGSNETLDHGLLSDLTVESSGLSGFSSLVDEIFEQERQSSAPAFSDQSYNHGPGPMSSHNGNPVNITSAGSSWNSSLYPMGNCNGRVPSASTGAIASSSETMKKMTASISDQDLASRSLHSVEVGSYIRGGPRVSAASARGNAFRKPGLTPG